MKKVFLLIMIICSCNILFAQSDKYMGSMKSNISLLDSAFQKGNFAELANNFERIGDAEKTQWLPYYYASYATVMSALVNQDKSKSDAIADKAEELIVKAEALAGKENSEIDVIKSMIASAHMMVDPQTRWQQYGAASASNIEKAKQLDPTNPRPVYLEGQAKFYTPESFGGGKAPAKVLFEKALGMFDTFKPKSPLDPAWGKSATQYFLSMSN
jgi:hypothetical protein